MKKIVFLVAYFGKFHNYFDVTLNSIKHNQNIKWIFFTDDRRPRLWPDNVDVHYMDFGDIQKYISSKFDFPISLKQPYKLSDFEPAYGYIFEDYIKDYDFWGHCNIDMIFGDLRSFLTDDIFDKYDKVFSLGHMTLYRNTPENNRRFMLPNVKGEYYYKNAFTSDDICLFIEVNNIYNNVCTLWKEKDFSVYNNYSIIANIAQKSSFFRLTNIIVSDDAKYVKSLKSRYKHQIFWWNNGKLYLSRIDKNGQYIQKEYIYIHLIRRTAKMKVNMPANCELYKIIPHEFVSLKHELNASNYSKEKWWNANIFYFELRYNNLKTKIKKKIKSID